MILYAPKYYASFACIKGDCRHSCCRLWDIGVDDATVSGLEGESHPLLQEFKARIVDGGDGRYIERCESGDCPFLSSEGLCRLISAFGDEHLPEICREHPRFYNYLGNRVEVGLGLSCEAAARIVLTSTDYTPSMPVGEISEEKDSLPYGLAVRERVFTLLDKVDYSELKARIVEDYSLSPILSDTDGMREAFCALEYLDEAEKDLILSAFSHKTVCDDEYLKRFFAYFIYRYVSGADSANDVRGYIGFALIMTELFGVMSGLLGDGIESAVEAARILSSEIEYSPDNMDNLLFEIDLLLV